MLPWPLTSYKSSMKVLFRTCACIFQSHYNEVTIFSSGGKGQNGYKRGMFMEYTVCEGERNGSGQSSGHPKYSFHLLIFRKEIFFYHFDNVRKPFSYVPFV